LFEQTNIPLVQYLVLAVAQLPFSLQEEPLYLIYNINHVTSLTSAELLTSLKEKHAKGKSTCHRHHSQLLTRSRLAEQRREEGCSRRDQSSHCGWLFDEVEAVLEDLLQLG
jgi:hypothetical protein